MAWSTAISTCSAKTPTVTGGTWKLATKDEWDLMISAAGSYNALHDGFSSVGGTNMQWSSTYYYWSSTEYDSGRAWNYNFSGGSWYSDLKENCNYVRACLAFDFNAPVTKMADNWYMISRQTQTRQSDWTALSAGSTTGRTLDRRRQRPHHPGHGVSLHPLRHNAYLHGSQCQRTDGRRCRH